MAQKVQDVEKLARYRIARFLWLDGTSTNYKPNPSDPRSAGQSRRTRTRKLDTEHKAGISRASTGHTSA